MAIMACKKYETYRTKYAEHTTKWTQKKLYIETWRIPSNIQMMVSFQFSLRILVKC
jgi:hypothetical protein